MRKLLLLLSCLLGIGTGGAWAETYTVGLNTGTFYNGGTTAITPSSTEAYASKWQSTANSPQLTLTCTNNNMVVDTQFRIHSDTYTFSVPTGYAVVGWTIEAYTNYTSDTSTIAGTTVSTDSSAPTTITGKTNTFTVSTGNPWIIVNSMIVEVEKVVTSLSDVQANKCYTVTANRSAWAVASGGTALTTIGQLNLAASKTDTKQQFAFVTPDNGTSYYLYAVGEGKFLTSSNTLTTQATEAEAVYFADASSFKANTVRVYFNSSKNINVGGSNQITIDTWTTADDGCAYFIVEAADFNPSDALAVFATTVNVTYQLYESGGTTLVSSAVSVQDKNSAVSVPASLTANTYFDYTTEGTIGEEDCTIKVIRTIKSGYVYPFTTVSNNKVYKISCPRGVLTTYTTGDATYLANTVKTELSLTEKNFAILLYESNYYLYSVSDAKFVQADGTLNTYPNNAVLSYPAGNSVPTFKLNFSGTYLNSGTGGTYGVIHNTYSTADDGNQYIIQENGDFESDALAAALAAFADRTPYFQTLNAVIAEAEGMTIGTGIGEYTKSENFDTALSAAKTAAANSEATANELTTAKDNLRTAVDACTIGSIAGKFVYLKNTAVTGYSYVGTAASGKAPLVADKANAGIYYITTDNKIVSYDQGKYLSTNAGAQCTVSGEAQFTIGNGGSGTYTLYYGDEGYLIAWTSGSTDRLSSVSDYARWTIEEVTTLPVTISSAGFASFYTPMALTLPAEGLKAYVGTISGTTLTLEAVDVIPAGAGVILEGAAGDYMLTVGGSSDKTSDIKGSVASQLTSAVAGGALTLTSDGGKPVFKNYTGTELKGFKGYIEANDVTAGGDVKSLTIQFLTDAISALQADKADAKVAYDLSGRRMERLQKGIYIVGGRKVIINK